MNRVLKYLLIALVLGQLVLAPFVVRAQEGDEDAEASESTEELDPQETEIVRMSLDEAIAIAHPIDIFASSRARTTLAGYPQRHLIFVTRCF